jgi:replicative DNA helicase
VPSPIPGACARAHREAIPLCSVRADDSDRFIPSGLRDLDELTGGLRRGDLAYLGGRPNMGKTAIGISIAINAAKAGHGVLIHSLEMDKDALLMRVASEAAYSSQTRVRYADAMRGRLNQSQKEAFVRAGLSRAGLPVLIDERSGLSAMQIAMETRKAQVYFERRGKRLGLVVIDHLTKIRAGKRYAGNRNQEVGEVSNTIKDLAKSENVAVLCLAQLNRAVEARTENKRPQLADLRESGEIEQDADTVLFAYRDAYYLARQRFDEGSSEEKLRLAELKRLEHILEISVGKARNGPDGRIELFCDMGSNVVANMERRAA